MTTPNPEELMQIPKLPEAELPALVARRAELRGERQKIEDELARIQTDAWNERQTNDDPLDAAAERLASGEIESASRGALPEHADVLRSRLDLVTRAEFKVREKITELRDTHNSRVARAFRSAHRQAAERIHKALIELVAANEAEELLRSKVPGGKLSPAFFPNVGKFGPHGGSAEYWRAWARRQGLIDGSDDFPMAAE